VQRRQSGRAVDPEETGPRGDPWDDAIRCHDRRVYLSVLALGLAPERAREVTQAAWTRLMEQQRRGALAEIELPGLAIRQARFLALNELERSRVERRVLAAVPDPPEAPDTERLVGGREEIERVRRDMFAERGFIDGPSPVLPDTTVNYRLYQVPVQGVIRQLASAAHLALAIPDSVGGTITVFARDADWDAVFAAVIDAASLGYRYDPTTKLLDVAPLAELHRRRKDAAPHAFLDVDPDAMDHATLVIDGAVTAVPPGRRIAVLAGMHRLELRKPDGSVTIYTLNVKAASHTAIPHSSNPEVWENHRGGDPQPAPPEK
jgi:hypothetical protein